jgi:hypothetical protein
LGSSLSQLRGLFSFESGGGDVKVYNPDKNPRTRNQEINFDISSRKQQTNSAQFF